MRAPLTEVVVVGGGPAGSMLAYHLARQGVEVVLYDREVFPRPKPCGGGLTGKALELIDVDLLRFVEDCCRRLQSTYQERRPFRIEADKPLAFMVRRDIFDACLLNRARQAGVAVREGVRVKNVTLSSAGVKVATAEGAIEAQYVVGADGANSIVARSLRLRKRKLMGRAIVCRVQPAHEAEMSAHRGNIMMDFGDVPRGYGWVFPKQDHLNVGVFTQDLHRHGLKDRLRQYLRFRFPQRSPAEIESIPTAGRLIPFGGKREPLHTHRAILVGDAAGLVDPLTGEGIYQAMRSGQIGAEIIGEAIAGAGPSSLCRYSDRIHQEMLRDFQAAWIISKIFYAVFPETVYSVLTRPRVVRTYQKIVKEYSRRGEVPYWDLMREFLTPGFLGRRRGKNSD